MGRTKQKRTRKAYPRSPYIDRLLALSADEYAERMKAED
jgi:hypothetical protein